MIQSAALWVYAIAPLSCIPAGFMAWVALAGLGLPSWAAWPLSFGASAVFFIAVRAACLVILQHGEDTER